MCACVAGVLEGNEFLESLSSQARVGLVCFQVMGERKMGVEGD